MTVNTSVTVGGTAVLDYKDLVVEVSAGNKANKSSNFRVIIDTPFGRHKTDFTVGNEVVIKADQGAAATTTIFTGILEQKQFRGIGNTEQLILRGRDFSARLQDLTVEPIVFTNSEISTIVTNIIAEVPDITSTNVNVTSTTLDRISFNQETVFDALQQLANLAGFVFFVDAAKDLHFEEAGLVSSGVTLDKTNTTINIFDRTREKMTNRVWVYGDRYLTGFREILNVGSPFDGVTSGSKFALVSKPHNTQVETSLQPGSILVGGIFGLNAAGTSGADYLVSFDDRLIILQSGTALGYNTVPASGGTVTVDYDREVPIVKFGQDNASIDQFGPRTKVIVDKSIRDPQTAVDILKKALEDNEPQQRLEFDLKGWFTFKVNETAKLVLPNFNLDEDSVGILSIKYRFDDDSVQSERIITVQLNEKVNDIIDELTDLRRRLQAIEGEDVDPSDVLTRLEFSTGSALVVGSTWQVKQRFNGSGFIIGGSGIALPSGVTTPPFLGLLGSFTAGSASHLGFSGRTSLEVVASGAFTF